MEGFDFDLDLIDPGMDFDPTWGSEVIENFDPTWGSETDIFDLLYGPNADFDPTGMGESALDLYGPNQDFDPTAGSETGRPGFWDRMSKNPWGTALTGLAAAGALGALMGRRNEQQGAQAATIPAERPGITYEDIDRGRRSAADVAFDYTQSQPGGRLYFDDVNPRMVVKKRGGGLVYLADGGSAYRDSTGLTPDMTYGMGPGGTFYNYNQQTGATDPTPAPSGTSSGPTGSAALRSTAYSAPYDHTGELGKWGHMLTDYALSSGATPRDIGDMGGTGAEFFARKLQRNTGRTVGNGEGNEFQEVVEWDPSLGSYNNNPHMNPWYDPRTEDPSMPSVRERTFERMMGILSPAEIAEVSHNLAQGPSANLMPNTYAETLGRMGKTDWSPDQMRANLVGGMAKHNWEPFSPWSTPEGIAGLYGLPDYNPGRHQAQDKMYHQAHKAYNDYETADAKEAFGKLVGFAGGALTASGGLANLTGSSFFNPGSWSGAGTVASGALDTLRPDQQQGDWLNDAINKVSYRAARGGRIGRGPLTIDHEAPARLVRGPGDGQSDDIPAMLSDGEYVFDADTVAALGDGSTAAGAKRLDEMRRRIRAHKRAAPTSSIPPKARPPEGYLKGGKRGA